MIHLFIGRSGPFTWGFNVKRIGVIIGMAALLAGCNSVQRSATLATPVAAGQPLSASPGDVVMDVKITKSLPNAFGNADLFGRTTDAGRVIVQLVAAKDGEARLVRQDTIIETNETTMTRTPIVSSYSERTRTGRHTVTTVIPPRVPAGYTVAGAPIELTLKPGQSVTVEGRTLTAAEIGPNRLDYTLN